MRLAEAEERGDLLSFQPNDLWVVGVRPRARIGSAQQSWRHVPMLPCIGDHGNCFSIVSGHYPEQRRMAVRMKSNPFTDLLIQHPPVRAHLAQKAQTVHHSVVQIDEFRFAEFVDINRRHCSNPLGLVEIRALDALTLGFIPKACRTSG